MRPGILYGRGQRYRRVLDQLRARDIYVVMRKIGTHVCIERDLYEGLGVKRDAVLLCAATTAAL